MSTTFRNKSVLSFEIEFNLLILSLIYLYMRSKFKAFLIRLSNFVLVSFFRVSSS